MIEDVFEGHAKARLLSIREALMSVRPDLSRSQLVTLLTVALRPGLSVNELAEQIGAPQQSASRYSAVLLGRYQTPDSDFREPLIIQEVNPDDPRRRALFLSDKGREVVAGMIAFDPTISSSNRSA